MTRIFACILLAACLCFDPVFADTIYLKNGKSIQGIITKEENDDVELDVGGGTVLFKAAEIKRIEMSGSKGLAEVKRHWETEKMRIEYREKEAALQRKQSDEKWGRFVAEETKRRAEKKYMDANAKEVPVASQGGHFFVRGTINDKVPVTLVIDTGCPVVLLTANVARKLGIDLSKSVGIHEVMVLNGAHKVATVTLDSFALGGAQANAIKAEVLLEDDAQIKQGLKDGLLGLSFLNQFDFAIDQKKMKLVLKPHQQKNESNA